MNYKRHRPRTSSCRGQDKHQRKQPAWDRYQQWPRWWDLVFHTRPRRRRTRVAIIQVMKGNDPDAILWPVEKKPHIYYW